MKPDGLIMRWSPYGPTETMDRLVDATVQHGMTVYARIDHAAFADKAGLRLQPREVLMIGNPSIVTPLIRAFGTAAIDLPLKAMVWQDEQGKTCVAYYDPTWLAERHGVSIEFRDLVATMKAHVVQVIDQALHHPDGVRAHG